MLMNLSFFLFLIGILGFILNRKNIILMIISIEIMLLAVTLLILVSSYTFDDNIGQTFSIYIISVAGAESVVGLSILVAYYRLIYSLVLYYNILNIKNNQNPGCHTSQQDAEPALSAERYLKIFNNYTSKET